MKLTYSWVTRRWYVWAWQPTDGADRIGTWACIGEAHTRADARKIRRKERRRASAAWGDIARQWTGQESGRHA